MKGTWLYGKTDSAAGSTAIKPITAASPGMDPKGKLPVWDYHPGRPTQDISHKSGGSEKIYGRGYKKMSEGTKLLFWLLICLADGIILIRHYINKWGD